MLRFICCTSSCTMVILRNLLYPLVFRTMLYCILSLQKDRFPGLFHDSFRPAAARASSSLLSSVRISVLPQSKYSLSRFGILFSTSL